MILPTCGPQIMHVGGVNKKRYKMEAAFQRQAFLQF